MNYVETQEAEISQEAADIIQARDDKSIGGAGMEGEDIIRMMHLAQS